MFITFPIKKYVAEFLKLIVCWCIILLVIFLLRYWIPSYNGEKFYFPLLQVGREEDNNDMRIKDAKIILKDYDWNILKSKTFLNLSVMVIAADRKNGYVTQSVAYLLKQMSEWKRIPNVLICNVEVNIFEELRQFVDKIPIYSINNGVTLHFNLSEDFGRIQKEAHDYWKCLQAGYTHKITDYVLLVEDDAVPVPNFETLLTSLMYQLDTYQMKHIDYVKMFHPWGLRKIPGMFQAVAFSISLASTLTLLVVRRYSFAFVILLTYGGYFCLWRDGYKEIFADFRFHVSSSAYIVPPESCCTPAVLFRTSSIPSMISHFKAQPAHANHAKDHILDESPFFGKAVDWNYFVHIGHFSSVRQKIIQLESLSKNV